MKYMNDVTPTHLDEPSPKDMETIRSVFNGKSNHINTTKSLVESYTSDEPDTDPIVDDESVIEPVISTKPASKRWFFRPINITIGIIIMFVIISMLLYYKKKSKSMPTSMNIL